MGYASEAIKNLDRDEHPLNDNCGCLTCNRLRDELRGFDRAVREIHSMFSSLHEKAIGEENEEYLLGVEGCMAKIRDRYPESFADHL